MLRLSGATQKLPTKKMLCILAYLALEGATARSKLADLFWSDCTTSDARRNLRRELYRLRQTAFANLLHGDEVLELGAEFGVDVLEAIALFESGQLEAALERSHSELLEGMALPQADGFALWLEDKRAWLQKRRMAALLELSEHAETRGDWAAALAWQQQLLALEPLQERTHRQIMRLMATLGKREDALRQFAQCQLVLKHELGLEPLPETLALCERIRNAQALEFSQTPQHPPLYATVPPLLGRTQVLHQLQSSHAGLCLLVAEAGMGKSRLLEALEQKWCLRFTPALQPVPLAALAFLIRAAWQEPESLLRLAALKPVWQQEIARLVPEILPQHIAPVQADERSKFFEGLSRAVEAVVGESAVLLVDDLHCADASSLAWLAYVVGRNSLRLVATTRPPEAELEAWLGKLPNTERIVLSSLLADDVRQMVQHLAAGEVSAGLWQHLEQSCAGNPFFLLETWRFLQLGGHIEQHNGVWVVKDLNLPLPPTVRDAVLQRVTQQGMATQRLLETAALCADVFTPDEILPATALGEWEGIEALEMALRAGLVQPKATGYALSHDLIRGALTQALSLERQRLIHRKLAVSLVQQQHTPNRIAWHFEQAEQPEKAVPWRIKAGQEALAVFAYQSALTHHRVAAQHSAPKKAFGLYGAMLEWHENLNQPQVWLQDLEAFEHLAAQLDATAQIEARLARVQYHIWHAEDAVALEQTQTLLAQTNLSAWQRAIALENHGYLLANLGQLEQSNAVRFEALALLPKSSTLRGKVYYGLLMNAYKQGQLQTALAWGAQAKADFTAQHRLGFLVNLHIMEGVVQALLGQELAAITALELARREAKRIVHPYRWVAALLNLFELYFERGEMPQAREVLLEVRVAQPQFSDPFTEGAYWRSQSQVAWFDGNTQTAFEYANRALALDEQSAALEHQVLGRLVLANYCRQSGDTTQAAQLLAEVQNLLKNSSLALYTHQHHLEQAGLALQLGNADVAFGWLGKLEPNGTSAQNALVQILSARAYLLKKDKRAAQKILSAVPETSSLDVRLQKLILQVELAPNQELFGQVQQVLAQELPALRRVALEAALRT
jgi:DNA-binding SARP family transcriptional activator